MDKLTLSGRQVPLKGKAITVKGRMVTPNGLADAVFEGGGVKGIGHVGARAYAEKIGVQWVNIAGTSAGAIIAALVATNYSDVGDADYHRELVADKLEVYLGTRINF